MSLIQDLQSKLKTDIVEFTYRKKDGTIRKATGTLNDQVIMEFKKLRPNIKNGWGTKNGVMPYFDLTEWESEDWRCFIMDNLISIDSTISK